MGAIAAQQDVTMSESSNAVKHELNTSSIDHQRNSFASTRVSGNARAILGNVYNNYFVSAKKTDKQIEAANNGPLTGIMPFTKHFLVL